MRIDLHTHSLLSDGSDTPTELVERAAAAGLDVVALTDHDTVAGWDEAIAAGRRLGVTVVRGTEFSTTNEGRGQHLLGYNFDRYHPAIVDILQRGATSRADRAADLFHRLDNLGLPVDRGYVNDLAGGIPSRMHVAAGMVKADHVADVDAAFAKWLNEGRPAYVQRYRPTIEHAIAAIRDAGGVSVIAHPWDERRGPGVTEERFAELASVGLDGIEVDHQQHSPKVRTELRSIAKNLGLAATGSSDHHGTRRSGYDLGCNLTDIKVAQRLLGSSFNGIGTLTGTSVSNVRVFDTSFDYKTDTPAKTRPDADRDSQMLRSDHELLWSKKLRSGVFFEPRLPSVPRERRGNYLMFEDSAGGRHVYGSDAVTASYTTWLRPKSLVNAIASLDAEERSRYLTPTYTIGSAMIWPVRKKDQPTVNTARGLRGKVADRMDLTLECIRRHYAGEPGSPLADVTDAYKDFFELFEGFEEFVDFFHLQDLVTPDYRKVQFFLPFDNFERSGTPATTPEYVTYREATLEFIDRRGRRMAKWVIDNHPEIEVRVAPPR